MANILQYVGLGGTKMAARLWVDRGDGSYADPVPVLTAASNGLTSSRIVAAATTNISVLKATPGNIARIDLFNVAAYDVFLKLYNKATSPVLASDVPIHTYPIKAGSALWRHFDVGGKWFSLGVSIAITKLIADTDTTVLVAGDVTGSIEWI